MATIVRGPYLQMTTPTTEVIRWYTSSATNTKVWWGTTTGFGNTFVNTVSTDTHEARLSGLLPGTKYFYGVGSTSQCLSSGSTNYFFTAPAVNSSNHIRIWVTGDFGVNTSNQKGVKDQFVSYNASNNPSGNAKVDLHFMVGDNAYGGGSNTDFDDNLFLGVNAYSDVIKKFNSFQVLGNHDYNQTGYNAGQGTNFPQFERFTQPADSQCGGVVSHIEKYYSVNWGNVHIINLDGYGTPSAPGSAMYKWLENDLKYNNKTWTIVFIHFPAFTHGTHNSDTAPESAGIQTNLLPLIYAFNVDLMVCGHSHVYERSYFMHQFAGASSAWNSSYITQTGLGDNSSVPNAPYDKSAGQSGTTFVVVGNSGQGGSITATGTWPHNAMIAYNKSTFSSLIIDINTDITGTASSGNYMYVKNLGVSGTILDKFIIKK
jgi:phosphodiesterase/alkaline phosphatase D-like protein